MSNRLPWGCFSNLPAVLKQNYSGKPEGTRALLTRLPEGLASVKWVTEGGEPETVTLCDAQRLFDFHGGGESSLTHTARRYGLLPPKA